MPSRYRLSVLIAVIVAAYAIFTLAGPQGLFAVRERFKEVRAVQEEVANLEAEANQKRTELEALSRPEVQQQEVQKELIKFKKGTREFVLPKSPETPVPPPTEHPKD
ncbi:MAG: hypothetical protein ACKV2U_28835 [Bryobacteraceae bacterium]